MQENLSEKIWRGNYITEKGYDPGPYGQGDPLTVVLVVIFLVYLVLSRCSS